MASSVVPRVVACREIWGPARRGLRTHDPHALNAYVIVIVRVQARRNMSFQKLGDRCTCARKLVRVGEMERHVYKFVTSLGSGSKSIHVLCYERCTCGYPCARDAPS